MLTHARWHLCKLPSAKLCPTLPLRRVRFVLGNGTPVTPAQTTYEYASQHHTNTLAYDDSAGVDEASAACTSDVSCALRSSCDTSKLPESLPMHTIDISLTHPRNVDMFIHYVDFVGLGVETLPTPATEAIVQNIVRDSFWGVRNTAHSGTAHWRSSGHTPRCVTRDSEEDVSSSLSSSPSFVPCCASEKRLFPSPQPLLEVILLPNGSGPCLGRFMGRCDVAEVTHSYMAAMRAVWQCRPATLLFMQHQHSESTLRRLGCLSPVQSLILRRSSQVSTRELRQICARHVCSIHRNMGKSSRRDHNIDDNSSATQLMQLSLDSLISHAERCTTNYPAHSFPSLRVSPCTRAVVSSFSSEVQLDSFAEDVAVEEDEGASSDDMSNDDIEERGKGTGRSVSLLLPCALHLLETTTREVDETKETCHVTPGEENAACVPLKCDRLSFRLVEASMRLLLRQPTRHARAFEGMDCTRRQSSSGVDRKRSTGAVETPVGVCVVDAVQPMSSHKEATGSTVTTVASNKNNNNTSETDFRRIPPGHAIDNTQLEQQQHTRTLCALRSKLHEYMNTCKESSWPEHALQHGFLQLMGEKCDTCRPSSASSPLAQSDVACLPHTHKMVCDETHGADDAHARYVDSLEHPYLSCAHALLFGGVRARYASEMGSATHDTVHAISGTHPALSLCVADLVRHARSLISFILRSEIHSIETVQGIVTLSSTLHSLATETLSAIDADSPKEANDVAAASARPSFARSPSSSSSSSTTVLPTTQQARFLQSPMRGSFPVLDDYILSHTLRSAKPVDAKQHDMPGSTRLHATESDYRCHARDLRRRGDTTEHSQDTCAAHTRTHSLDEFDMSDYMQPWMPGIGVDAAGYLARLLRYTDALCAACCVTQRTSSCSCSSSPTELQVVLRSLQHDLRTHLTRRFDLAAPRLWKSEARLRAFPFLESVLLSLQTHAGQSSSSSSSSSSSQCTAQQIWALYFTRQDSSRACGLDADTSASNRADDMTSYSTFALAMLYPHVFPRPIMCGRASALCRACNETPVGSGDGGGRTLIGQHALVEGMCVRCALTQPQHSHLRDLVKAAGAVRRPHWAVGCSTSTAHHRDADGEDEETWCCVYAAVDDTNVCRGLFASLTHVPWHALLG